jgi:putative transposase
VKLCYKYRIYPDEKQKKILERTFKLCCELYNACILQRKIYLARKKKMGKFDQIKELPSLKKEFPEYNEVYAQVLYDVVFRVKRAFDNFFNAIKRNKKLNGNGRKKRVGFPKYKPLCKYKSITYPQIYKLDLIGNSRYRKIYIPKIGYVKIKWHRDLPENARIKFFHVIKHADKYYISVGFEINNNIQTREIDIRKIVGIDVGLEHLATLSDGTVISFPKYFKAMEWKLKLAQQILSRKKKGTKAYENAKIKVERLHEKILNLRNNYLHQISKQIVDKYDVIVVEDLNVMQMLMENKRGLNKEIADASWKKLLDFIEYKAIKNGKRVVKVDPRNTSQICCNCGNIVKKELRQRIHICPYCGIKIHRDLNAAKVLQKLGTSLLFEKKSEVQQINAG